MDKSGNRIHARFPQTEALTRKMRQLQLKWGGIGFVPAQKYYSIPLAAIIDVVKTFSTFAIDKTVSQAYDLAIEKARQAAEEEARQRQAQDELIQKLNAVAEDILTREYEVLDGTRKLPYDKQKEAVRFLFRNNKALWAMEVGLGKTRAGCLAGKIYNEVTGWRVVVIGPAGLKLQWLEEADRVGIEIQYISAASIPVVDPASPTKEWKEPFLLICDEAHFYQSFASARTKRMLAIAELANGQVYLSGTPFQNSRPANIKPHLMAMKHRLVASPTFYDKRYCGAKPTRQSKWDASGATNLEELHKHLTQGRDAIMFVATKAESIDLPEFQRIVKPLDFAGDAAQHYQSTLKRLHDAYEERLRKGLIVRKGEHLVILNHLRHAASMAKVPDTVSLIEELVEENRPVVVFTEFTDSAQAIAERVNAKYGKGTAAFFDSKMNVTRRNDMKKAFMASDGPMVFVSTIKTGGTGLDGLQVRAKDMILVDRPWTSTAAEQTEGRVFRPGQKGSTMSFWLSMTDTCRAIDALVDAKANRSSVLLLGRPRVLAAAAAGQDDKTLAKLLFETLFEDREMEKLRKKLEKQKAPAVSLATELKIPIHE